MTAALHRMVQQAPDEPLTVFGDRVRTVAESADRVARLAGALGSLGVSRDDRVGILALNSDRYHEYLLGVPWADAMVTPLNIRWSPAELRYALRESGTRVLFVDDAFADLVPELRAGLSTVVFMGDGRTPPGMLDYETLIAGAEARPDARRGGDAPYGVFYTGGTSGNPKGVLLSHTNLTTSALGSLATRALVEPGGRLLHAAPMFHLADIAVWTAGMLVGCTHVIVPVFTPPAVLAAITEYQVTATLLVPAMIQLLLDSPDLADHDLTSVRTFTYAGSPISEALLDRARKAFPAAGFTQAYGMTELAPVATLLSTEDHHYPALRRSAGRAAPHAEVRVVDVDGNEVPRGTVGEVVVRGDNVMLGYWNQPEATAAAVRDGWMHTGDGGYLDDRGYVFIVDRLKDMIVSGGENVYSAEVENALAKHPSVASCAVIGVPDEQWGERVHAVVVRRDDTTTEDELREHCREHIAGYKVPRSVEFTDALPLSGAGKILKRELRRQYWGDGERQVH